MQRMHGFSTIKLLLFAGVIAAAVSWGYAVLPPWYDYWKIQDLFESVVRNMAEEDAATIRRKLPALMDVKYIDRDALPQEFWDNLEIEADGERVRISSFYHVVVWPLGVVQDVDDPNDYDPEELHGLDRLRDWAKMEFEFEPHAETP